MKLFVSVTAYQRHKLIQRPRELHRTCELQDEFCWLEERKVGIPRLREREECLCRACRAHVHAGVSDAAAVVTYSPHSRSHLVFVGRVCEFCLLGADRLCRVRSIGMQRLRLLHCNLLLLLLLLLLRLLLLLLLLLRALLRLLLRLHRRCAARVDDLSKQSTPSRRTIQGGLVLLLRRSTFLCLLLPAVTCSPSLRTRVVASL